jgi:predicted negative regulator of RcsB-dependent stress response
LDVYKTEDEQIEALKSWWKENGKSVVLGVVLGLGAIFGWRMWQFSKTVEAEAASTLYEQMVAAVRNNDGESAAAAGRRILDEHASTVYPVFAGMILARLAVENDRLEEAESHLRMALAKNTNSGIDRELRLRLARVLAARGNYDDALAQLQVKSPGAYSAGFDELRGDIEVLRGNLPAARMAYERAIAAARDSGADITLLEAKLDNLGRGIRS